MHRGELLVLDPEAYRRISRAGATGGGATQVGMNVDEKYDFVRGIDLFAEWDLFRLYRLCYAFQERVKHD